MSRSSHLVAASMRRRRHPALRAVAIVAGVALLAAACGGGDDDAPSAGGLSGGDDGDAGDFGLVTQGVTDDTVKVGFTYNTTGCGDQGSLLDAFPEAGGDTEKSIDAFTQYVNDNDLIDGYTLELVVADDGQGGCDERAGAAARKLVDDEEVFLVIPGLHEVSDYAIQNNIPTLVGRDTPEDLERIGANGIDVIPAIGDSFAALASFGVNYLESDEATPCLLYPDDDIWAENSEVMLDQAEEHGLEFADVFAFSPDISEATQQAATGALRLKDAGCDHMYFIDFNPIALLFIMQAAEANNFTPDVWTFNAAVTQLADSDLTELLPQEQWKNAIGLSQRVPAGEHPAEGNCKEIYETYYPDDGLSESAATQLACAQILSAAEIMRRAIEETGELTADSLLVGADAVDEDFYFDAHTPIDWQFPGPDGPFRTKGTSHFTVVEWNPDAKTMDFPEFPTYWKTFEEGGGGGEDITDLFQAASSGDSDAAE